MASIEEILGKQINSIKELRAEIKNLQDSLIGVDADSEQFKTTSQQLAAAQEELTKVTRAGKEENVAAKDSLVGMRQEYKALYDQYKLLSEEQRKSDFGKAMADSLESLSDKINDTQKGIGDFRGNIGRYADNITEAFSKMGISVGALKGPLDLVKTSGQGLGKVFKDLAKNPWMLALTVLITILAKVAAAIKNNEELTQRLHQAMSVFKPVLDAVSNAFDFLAGLLVKVIEGFSKVAEKVMSIIPGYKKAAQSHKELTKATNDLIKAQREAAELNAQRQSEVEDLRARAAAATDNAEKLQLLEEAKAKQAEIDQTNLELAQEDLRIKEALAEKTANDTQAEEELAAARKKVGDITAEASRHEKEYNEQIKTTTQAIEKQQNTVSAGKSIWEQEEEELEKFNTEYEKSLKTREQQTNDYYDDLLKKAKKHKQDTTNIEAARVRDLSVITQTAQQEELNREKRHRDNLSQLRNDSIGDAAADLGELQVNLKGIGSTFNTISETFSEKGFKELAEVFKVLKESGDWSKLSDFSYVLGLFPQFEDNLKNIRDIWPELVAPIKKLIQRVQTLFGVTIENAQDLQDQLALIVPKTSDVLDQAVEKQGTEAAKRIAETMREVNMTMTDADLEALNSDEMNKKIAENNFIRLSMERDALETELADFKGTRDQKLELMQRYYAVVAELRQKDYEDEKAKQEALEALKELQTTRTEEMIESLIDMTGKMASSLSSYKSTRESVIDSEVKAGNITEAEGKKRKDRLLALERAERDFAIATIAADAAVGMFNIWKGWATETGTINPQTAAAAGPGAAGALAVLNAKSTLSAVAKSASLAATAAAQIAAAKGKYIVAKNNAIAEEGGGSTGVAAAPMLIDSTPYSYTRTVQTAEEEDAINQRPIYVTVTDLEEGLGHRAQVTNETSF